MAREIFTCPNCNNKQPLSKQAKKSIECVGCETEYAIVKDGEGGTALAELAYQKKDHQ